VGKMEFKLNNRQADLRDLAEDLEFAFYPMLIRNVLKYKIFPVEKGTRVLYEENLLSKYLEKMKIEISDVTVSEGAGMAQENTKITMFYISELQGVVPDFFLEPEGLWTTFSELAFGKDIDFPEHDSFSKRYYLRGDHEAAVRDFFSTALIRFLEQHPDVHIETSRNRILLYKRKDILSATEIKEMLRFIEAFVLAAPCHTLPQHQHD
jgi:hypothetical protein